MKGEVSKAKAIIYFFDPKFRFLFFSYKKNVLLYTSNLLIHWEIMGVKGCIFLRKIGIQLRIKVESYISTKAKVKS